MSRDQDERQGEESLHFVQFGTRAASDLLRAEVAELILEVAQLLLQIFLIFSP